MKYALIGRKAAMFLSVMLVAALVISAVGLANVKPSFWPYILHNSRQLTLIFYYWIWPPLVVGSFLVFGLFGRRFRKRTIPENYASWAGNVFGVGAVLTIVVQAMLTAAAFACWYRLAHHQPKPAPGTTFYGLFPDPDHLAARAMLAVSGVVIAWMGNGLAEAEAVARRPGPRARREVPHRRLGLCAGWPGHRDVRLPAGLPDASHVRRVRGHQRRDRAQRGELGRLPPPKASAGRSGRRGVVRRASALASLFTACASAALAQTTNPPAPAPTPSGKPVQGLTVQGGAADVQRQIDRKSYNLATDQQAAAGSLADVLRNLPRRRCRSAGPSQYPRRRQRHHSGRRPALAAVPGPRPRRPAAAVARQPVRTHRGDHQPLGRVPAYEGTGGIINLITKKRRQPGREGSVSAKAVSTDGLSANARGVYATPKLTLYGTAFFVRNRRELDNTATRQPG